MFEGQSIDDVEVLMNSNVEFRRLYNRHKQLDKQVLDAELGVLQLDDARLARRKKEKLQTKYRLTQWVAQHSAPRTPSPGAIRPFGCAFRLDSTVPLHRKMKEEWIRT